MSPYSSLMWRVTQGICIVFILDSKIKEEKKIKLWECLLKVILPHTLYIYMDTLKKKKTWLTLSDTGFHFVFTLITSFRHRAIDGASEGGISLTGNYEKELIWPLLAARKRERDREWGEEIAGRVERWSQGRLKEEAPPQRAGSWGENSDNESAQLPTWSKTSDSLESPKEGQSSPRAPSVLAASGFNKDFGGETLYSLMMAICASLLKKCGLPIAWWTWPSSGAFFRSKRLDTACRASCLPEGGADWRVSVALLRTIKMSCHCNPSSLLTSRHGGPNNERIWAQSCEEFTVCMTVSVIYWIWCLSKVITS